MPKKVIIRTIVSIVGLILVLWAIFALRGGSAPEPTDRNQYISERNRQICKYGVVEIRIERPDKTPVSFKKMGAIWEGGGLSNDFIKTQIEEFCSLKISDETNLDRLKAELEWIEDLKIMFEDGSSIDARLSQNGVLQVGIRYYFAAPLLRLIQDMDED